MDFSGALHLFGHAFRGPSFYILGANWTFLDVAVVVVMLGWLALPLRLCMISLVKTKKSQGNEQSVLRP